MNYESKELLTLLNSETIKAICKIYDIGYKTLSVRLGFTKQNLVYLLKNEALKDYQKEIILDLFLQYGMDGTTLIIVNSMITKKKKLVNNK